MLQSGSHFKLLLLLLLHAQVAEAQEKVQQLHEQIEAVQAEAAAKVTQQAEELHEDFR